METKCNHKLKYNKEQDFIFCKICGERWIKPDEPIITKTPCIPPTDTIKLPYIATYKNETKQTGKPIKKMTKGKSNSNNIYFTETEEIITTTK